MNKPRIRAYSDEHFRYMLKSNSTKDLESWNQSSVRFYFHRKYDNLYLDMMKQRTQVGADLAPTIKSLN